MTNTATLEFISNADNFLAPIILTHSYIYPHPVHVWLEADRTPLTSSGVWKLKVKALPDELKDVRSIDLALNYNTDLLGYLENKSSGPNIIGSSDGKTLMVSGSPMVTVDADSSIAAVEFEVYLAKDTVTTFSIGSVALNNGDPKFMGCIAYPLSSGVDFTYLNTCNDASIRRFMRGEPMQLSIRPNPAQDEIEVDLQSPLQQDASIEIRNALGARVYSDRKNLISGSNILRINTETFSKGMYLIRVSSQNASASLEFVKIK
jgi:hypothetical protein